MENILLNFIILVSTGIISKQKIDAPKILLASIIGGIYAILGYIVNIPEILNIIIKIVMSIILVQIAFNTKKIKTMFKELIFFYLVSFTFGGAAFMLLFFVSPQNIEVISGHFVGTYPLKVTILGAIIGFILILCVAQIIKNKMSKKAMLCDLEIFYNGKVKKIKTMIDTGNLLKEPITQTDVIIVEKESLKGIVDNDVLQNIKNILQGKWLDTHIHDYHFKLIPFMSLGNENGLLIGFKPDYVKIYSEEECIQNDVIIGIYDGKLCKTNLYTSLIGLDILKKGSKKDEFVKSVKI